jgi:hypothetical protein
VGTDLARHRDRSLGLGMTNGPPTCGRRPFGVASSATTKAGSSYRTGRAPDKDPRTGSVTGDTRGGPRTNPPEPPKARRARWSPISGGIGEPATIVNEHGVHAAPFGSNDPSRPKTPTRHDGDAGRSLAGATCAHRSTPGMIGGRS